MRLIGKVFLTGCIIGVIGTGFYLAQSTPYGMKRRRCLQKMTSEIFVKRKLNDIRRQAAYATARLADDAGEKISDLGRHLSKKIK